MFLSDNGREMSLTSRTNCEQNGVAHYYVCNLTRNVCVMCGDVEGNNLNVELQTFDDIQDSLFYCSTNDKGKCYGS